MPHQYKISVVIAFIASLWACQHLWHPPSTEAGIPKAFNECHYTALPMDRHNSSAIQVANRGTLPGISIVHMWSFFDLSLNSGPPVSTVLIHFTHWHTVASPYTQSEPLQIKAGFSTSKTKNVITAHQSLLFQNQLWYCHPSSGTVTTTRKYSRPSLMKCPPPHTHTHTHTWR